MDVVMIYFYSKRFRFAPSFNYVCFSKSPTFTHFGPVCPQMMPDTRNETAALSTMSQGRMKAIRDMKPLLSNQTEDCLYLNVYSPLLNSGKHILKNCLKS